GVETPQVAMHETAGTPQAATAPDEAKPAKTAKKERANPRPDTAARQRVRLATRRASRGFFATASKSWPHPTDSSFLATQSLCSPRARNGETFQRSPCLFDGHSLMNTRCVLVFLVQILLAV